MNDAYALAQDGLDRVKAAHLLLLDSASEAGMSNAEIGRALGIYEGYSEAQEGHISRTVLERLKEEGAVEQIESTKKWRRRLPVRALSTAYGSE